MQELILLSDKLFPPPEERIQERMICFYKMVLDLKVKLFSHFFWLKNHVLFIFSVVCFRRHVMAKNILLYSSICAFECIYSNVEATGSCRKGKKLCSVSSFDIAIEEFIHAMI